MSAERITFDMISSDDGALAVFTRVGQAAQRAAERTRRATDKLTDTMRDDEDET